MTSSKWRLPDLSLTCLSTEMFLLFVNVLTIQAVYSQISLSVSLADDLWDRFTHLFRVYISVTVSRNGKRWGREEGARKPRTVAMGMLLVKVSGPKPSEHKPEQHNGRHPYLQSLLLAFHPCPVQQTVPLSGQRSVGIICVLFLN